MSLGLDEHGIVYWTTSLINHKEQYCTLCPAVLSMKRRITTMLLTMRLRLTFDIRTVQ
jgi:hypothetical protein